VAQSRVKIKVSNGSIQLVWTYRGKREYLSLGLKDTASNQRLAKLKAAEIERDILLERYEGKGKYQSPVTVPPKAIEARTTSIKDIWPLFVEYQRGRLSPSTMANGYRSHTASIGRMPTNIDIHQPSKLRDWVEANHTKDAAKRLLVAIRACCRWATEQGHLSIDPMAGFKIDFGRNKSEETEIHPLTAEERDRLLQVLEESPKWWHYRRIVAFLFYTGCRPSEAIALQWEDVDRSMQTLTFQQAAVLNEQGQLRIKPGLKRQRRRTIKLNDRVREVLGERHHGLIFPAPNGGIQNAKNLAQRIWPPALEAAGIERRKLYQTRHTFITLALASGLSPQDVAKIVGNSAKVIYENYAGTSRNLELPDL
jgi:integrase